MKKGFIKAHSLKTESKYYRAVVDGSKTAEVRFNDRYFKVGDFLHLHEFDEGRLVGSVPVLAEITHIVDLAEVMGASNNFVLLSFRKIDIDMELF